MKKLVPFLVTIEPAQCIETWTHYARALRTARSKKEKGFLRLEKYARFSLGQATACFSTKPILSINQICFKNCSFQIPLKVIQCTFIETNTQLFHKDRNFINFCMCLSCHLKSRTCM